MIRRTLDSSVERTDPVLELGCSSGRHLAHLHEHGYENLYGIEINEDAFDVMDRTYPDLAACGTFVNDTIEKGITDVSNGEFGAVYSVETLQHIHPDNEWVFDEISRITRALLMTVEIEEPHFTESTDSNSDDERSEDYHVEYVDDDFPLYYRNWNRVFAERGFVEIETEQIRQDTFRAFRASRK